jgi:hypothetical protein
MGDVEIGARRAAHVGDLLQRLGKEQALPEDTQANAAYWATAMAHTMDERDIQTVAWLLLEASGDHHMPFTDRHIARYWAALLEVICDRSACRTS